MAGPYEGLNIVEFGRFIAAPYCGQLFADGGADVIKVEPITGDDARHNGTRLSPTEARQYLNKNRGKRSISVDLSQDDVREIVRNLASQADVVLANFRPGQAEQLGLDYAHLSALNPRLIYAENTAFGKKGPMANEAGMDILLQGYTGIAAPSRDGPKMSVDPIIDYTAALLLAWGVATALYHRERSGAGQQLDVSLLQAALVIQNNTVNHIDQADQWRHEFVDYLKAAFRDGKTLSEVLEHHEQLKPSIRPPYYGLFETRDGFIALAAGGVGLRKKVAEILNIEDPELMDPGLPADTGQSPEHPIHDQVSEALRLETTEVWQRRFADQGIPAGPVNFREQILDDLQCWENDYLVRLEHEEIGGMTVVAPPVKFAETPLAAQGPTPVLGRHTREILKEVGLSSARIEEMVAGGQVRAANPV